MSLIISLETSGKACSVALSNNGELVDFRYQKSDDYPHSRVLHVFIDEILKKNKVTPNQLEAVAVSSGPGSYTGLRIGVAAAKGLCFALEIPLIKISTLWLIAKQAQFNNAIANLYVAMIDARRMEVYTQSFNAEMIATNEVAAKVIEKNSFEGLNTGQIIFCGDGSDKCKEVINEKQNFTFLKDVYPDAKNMVEIAYEKFNAKNFVDVNYFEPFYLKEYQSQAEFHKK